MNENNSHPQLQNTERSESVRPLDRSNAGTPKGSDRPIVRITSYRCRPLDKDNLYRGCKSLLDGVHYAGLILGDAEDQIDYEARQIKVAHRCEEKTVVELELQ